MARQVADGALGVLCGWWRRYLSPRLADYDQHENSYTDPGNAYADHSSHDKHGDKHGDKYGDEYGGEYEHHYN